MTEILFGGRDVIEATPATISLINCNSPLRWDDRMLDAQFEYCAANQPVVMTPFLLMGAMSSVTIPAAQLLPKMKAFEPEGSYFALTLGANRVADRM